MNWRRDPLTTSRIVVALIASITTRAGLKLKADLDTVYCPTNLHITDAKIDTRPIQRRD